MEYFLGPPNKTAFLSSLQGHFPPPTSNLLEDLKWKTSARLYLRLAAMLLMFPARPSQLWPTSQLQDKATYSDLCCATSYFWVLTCVCYIFLCKNKYKTVPLKTRTLSQKLVILVGRESVSPFHIASNRGSIGDSISKMSPSWSGQWLDEQSTVRAAGLSLSSFPCLSPHRLASRAVS